MLKLWNHQQTAISLARTKKNLALFMSMGTGKTATMIRILQEDYEKYGRVRNTLIFSPLSVVHQWASEFEKFSNVDKFRILPLTQNGRKRVDALLGFVVNKSPCIVITNYEALGIKQFYDLLLKFSPEILVCDESHRLKSYNSKRSKLMLPLAIGAERRFILTGTPILNSLLDIFGQFRILDWDIFGGNFFSFRARYFIDANSRMPSHVHFPNWQPLPDAAEKIGKIISTHSVQAKKEDCMDLPPKYHVEISVPMSGKQRAAYEMMSKYFIAEHNGATTIASIAMIKMLRLQQIVSGYVLDNEDEEKVEWFKENPRLDALEDLLDGLGNEKVIIWTTFKPTYEKIAEISKKLGRSVSFLTGEESIDQKQKSIKDFRFGEINTLIANPQAGGTGINLTEAKYAIYYAKNFSLEQYLQSQDRNHRGGSEMHDKITYYHLMAEDSLDAEITRALINKKDLGETLLNWANNISLAKSKSNIV